MKTIIALGVVMYCLFWFASGCTAWGQNGGAKCHIGYSPITHLCVDPPDMPKCSGWSPPGICRGLSQAEEGGL